MERFEASSEDMKKSGEKGHSLWRAILIVTHAVVLIGSVAISNIPKSAFPDGAFLSTTGNISRRYLNPITPAHWTFSIWLFIYGWQLLHAAYSLTLLCRRQKDGRYLYAESGHVHFSFYVVFIVDNISIIAWLFVYDRQYLSPSFLLQCINSFSLCICVIILCVYLNKAGPYLESSGNAKEIWFTRIFLINGVVFYATWSSMATSIALSSVLIYREGFLVETASWISLSIIAVEVIVWFILETLLCDRYLRYCFSQYIVLVIALVGLLEKNYEPTSPKTYHIFALALTVFSGLLAITKVIVMLVRARKYPIKYTASH